MFDLRDFVRPTARDEALLGHQARLYVLCRLANAFLFALVVAIVASDAVTPSVDAGPAFAHWPSGRRSLTIVDHTGDSEWGQAVRWAVDRWNEAGSELRLSWAPGRGPCRYDGTRIGVCAATSRQLGSLGKLHFEGMAEQDREGEHARAALVRVCSDCALTASRRRQVVIHELGHAFGLAHSDRRQSVMFASGGSDVPDALDREALRRTTDHLDPPGRR